MKVLPEGRFYPGAVLVELLEIESPLRRRCHQNLGTAILSGDINVYGLVDVNILQGDPLLWKGF